MTEPEAQPEPPRRRRRWLQYSLRTLLVLSALFAVGMSWIAVKLTQARKQRETVEAIKKLGGIVLYDHELDRAVVRYPTWLCKLFGDEFFHSVGAVHLTTSDAGLARCKDIPQLHQLWLTHAKITDAGTESIEGLIHLRLLELTETSITDTQLAHLKKLRQLEVLWLEGTHITDEGLTYLKGFDRLVSLSLARTGITDAGLVQLKECSELKHVLLDDTEVTREGVTRLQRALPRCRIDWKLPTKDERQARTAPDQPR